MTATLPTLGALSLTDGRLMCDIGDVYEVVSHFIGRPASTHELPSYGRKIAPLITAAFPSLAGDQSRGWEGVRDDAINSHGERINAHEEWAGCLADGKGPIETLIAAVAEARS